MRLQKISNRFKKPLRVYWWRLDYPNKVNFGDEITPLIIERLFGRRVVWTPQDQCELAGVGSIIEILQNESKGNLIKVWGSGFIEGGGKNSVDNLDFCAIRGKKSQSRIDKETLPLGDPGLLLPLIFKKPVDKKYKLGLVAHYVDSENSIVKEFEKIHPDSIVIDPLWPIERVVESIRSCRYIISSSLHGLIVADAYSIPNLRIVFSAKIKGGDYKFEDYNSIFKERRSVSDYYKGLDRVPTPEEISEKYVPISRDELEQTQDSLVKSFPF